MPHRMFEQIDDLERGARELYPIHDRARADDVDFLDHHDSLHEQASKWVTTDYDDLETVPDLASRRQFSQYAYPSEPLTQIDRSSDYRSESRPDHTKARSSNPRGSGPCEDSRYPGRDHERMHIILPERPFETSLATQKEDDYWEDECDRRQHKNPAITPQSAPDRGVKGSHAALPVVQGIKLLPTHQLPDRFRAIFPFPLLNAVQSKSFDTIYKTDDNFVLSAPTGSGKTAAMELAICRIVNKLANGTFKIVYQAPTKSLCAERQRDWQAKFGPLDLQVAELTGDTDSYQIRNVQHASIIVTTPEKWDSITRKWKDHQKLMQMVRLFLIDEVHILKEDRGATLEAVVSRMKTMGTEVRFVALSATVPNSHDIATWLSKNSSGPNVPAALERFGEEFRPVPLQKHVCGYKSALNDFAFQKTLNSQLTEVIMKWSQGKPLMIFCFTRNGCVETAKILATWSLDMTHPDRLWPMPARKFALDSKDLRETMPAGVAFHHAGLSLQDRNTVEKAYLDGHIGVICCTSTLAVGVNLPCHMVIIKGTVMYTGGAATSACKEYSDLETMQMLGRAGRPQFDASAIAVIMTRLHRVEFYEKMISGQEILESCLHRNLIDHLNAEIGLGTVTSIATAKQWLTSTFLFVRLKANPDHYLIDGDEPGRNLEDRLERICTKYVTQLQETDLVKKTANLECTEFGEAMARYSLKFETMKVFLSLPNKAKISEILSAIANASEFRDIRFRAGEKPIYKTMNKNAAIKFPIPVNIDIPVHKILLIIQCVLGSIELDVEDNKHRQEFVSCKSVIFLHATRLIRCIVDCKLLLRDSVGVRNALMLARSFGAQIWDDSPLHMRQLESIGAVLVRKLVAANINSIEDLCQIEPHKIELATSRNTPFGTQLQERARSFPNPRISLKVVGEPQVKKGVHVAIMLRAEIGFTNEKLPETFNRRPVFVCLIVETSDGSLIHFARMSAKKLDGGQDLLFTADLTKLTQAIRGHVMCDDIAGTQQSVFLKLEIPNFMFPVPKLQEAPAEHHSNKSHLEQSGTKRRNVFPSETAGSHDKDDHFGDDSIDDADLVLAESKGFTHIDSYESADEHNLADTKGVANRSEARQLQNGRWACNHACKDKSRCKHLCCRDGLDKPPKMPKQKSVRQEPNSGDLRQSQLTIPVSKARKPSHKNHDSRVIGKAVTPGRATVADAVDLSEPGVAFDTYLEPRLESFDRRTDHQEVSANLLTYDSFEVVNNLPEGDYGSELLDNADLPDIVDIVGPAKLDAGFPKSNGSRQECNPGAYTRTAVCKMQMLEPGNNGKVLDRGSDPSHSRDICSEDSSVPTSLTTLSNAEPTKCPSLFVNTSDSVEQASPGAKPKSGKRKASDEPAGPAAGASKRIAPPTPTTSSTRRPTSERPVIEAGEFMKETATDTHAIFDQKGVETGKDDVYEWFAEHFGFEHFNWVG